jgi:hypothetical protein
MNEQDPGVGLIQAVPSAPVDMNWIIDAVVLTQTHKETGEERSQPRIILSIVSPLGVNKLWFEPENFRQMCVQGLEITKKAEQQVKGQGLQIARGIPSGPSEQISQKAAEEILRKLANGGGATN